jgi:hypothetical protein
MDKTIMIDERKRELYRIAAAHTPKLQDGSMLEQQLEDNLALLCGGESEEVKRRQAKYLIEELTKEGATEADVKIRLPNGDTFDSEPHRLVRNNAGRITELMNATLEFIEADAARARVEAEEAQREADRLTARARALAFHWN